MAGFYADRLIKLIKPPFKRLRRVRVRTHTHAHAVQRITRAQRHPLAPFEPMRLVKRRARLIRSRPLSSLSPSFLERSFLRFRQRATGADDLKDRR